MIKLIFKTSIYVLLLMSTSIVKSQEADDQHSQYAQGMTSALKLWGENKPTEALNMFDRIAKVETQEWLPKYYAAQIHIIGSFGEKDENKLSAKLLEAQNYINDAKTLSKDNPDLMNLQAMLYTAWIAFDGQKYGMLYSAKASDLYAKALALAPDNPRMILAKAEWEMGMARFFGKSLDPYCKDIQKAIDLFATFKPAEAFYPTYGKERALQIQETTCK